MIVIGVDPGKDGAIAALSNESGEMVVSSCHLMPTTKANDYDVKALMCLLRDLKRGSSHFVVERLTALPPAMGGSFANFSRGWCMGMLETVICCINKSGKVTFVPPRTWQAKMFGKLDKGATKSASSALAKTFATEVELPLLKNGDIHYGVSDAICIAAYGFWLQG